MLVSFTCLGLLTLIVYNHCRLFVELSFIALSLVSVFAICYTDGVKTELKDDFIKHRGSRQIRFHKKNFCYRTPLDATLQMEIGPSVIKIIDQ